MPGPEEPITKVVVHPIVLLSVVDHFYRMGKVGNQKRVVGVLLGSRRKGVLDVANSFAGENQSLAQVLEYVTGVNTYRWAEIYLYVALLTVSEYDCHENREIETDLTHVYAFI